MTGAVPRSGAGWRGVWCALRIAQVLPEMSGEIVEGLFLVGESEMGQTHENRNIAGLAAQDVGQHGIEKIDNLVERAFDRFGVLWLAGAITERSRRPGSSGATSCSS